MVIHEKDKSVFELGIEYLMEKGNVSRQHIEQQIEKPQGEQPESIEDIFHRLAIAAQNYQYMPNVIGKSIGGVHRLNEVLFNFSPIQVVDVYGKDYEKLLETIIEKLKPSGEVRRTPQSSWPKYCRSLLASADFMSQFSSIEDFYEWCDYFDQDSRTRVALPLLISVEITGIGFALACDFLKEIGYLNFGKPDVHIREICMELGLSEKREDIAIFKVLQRIAKSNNVSVFAVDKLFWIIGSDNLGYGTSRNDFIRHVNSAE